MFQLPLTLLAQAPPGEVIPPEDGMLNSDWLPGLALVVVVVVIWGAWHYRRRRSGSS